MVKAKLWLAVGLVLSIGAACETSGNPDDGFDAQFRFDSGAADGGARPDAYMLRFPEASVEACMTAGTTIGRTCSGNSECNDGCFCNGAEVCDMTSHQCVAGSNPCTSTVECVQTACLEETNTCYSMPNHASCQDGNRCNGQERCDVMMGCQPGSPLYCTDDNACTIDACDPVMGCTFSPRDLDGDGFTDGRCGGMDCDDDPRTGRMVYPGAPEDCGNRRDDNCDGFRDYADPTCRPMNDACDGAQVLPRAGTYSGSTDGLRGDYMVACSTITGADAVFKFTLTEAHDVRISVSPAGRVNTAVSLRPFASCGAGPDDKCAAANAGSSPTLIRRSLPAGDWAIIVKSASNVDFDLSLMIMDPTAVPLYDVCNGSTQDITEAASMAGGTRLTGNFAETDDNYSLQCNTTAGSRDAAYKFTITTPKDVVFQASVDGSRQAFVSIVTDCTMASTTVACLGASGAGPTLRRRELPPGTYYVLVESNVADATSWTLNATITDVMPRLAGDACSSAISLLEGAAAEAVPTDSMPHTFTQNVALSSTLELDYGTSCGGGSAPARDTVFYFDVPTGGADVVVETLGTGFFGSHFQALETTCGMRSSELRCRSGGTTGTPPAIRQAWRSLAAGRYFVVVSSNATSGMGTVNLTLTRPPTPVPPNDQCPGATVIDFSGTGRYTGDLTGYEDNAPGCSGTAMADVMYTFTLTERRTITLITTRLSGMGNVVTTLRTTCATAGTATGCVTTPTGMSGTLVRVLDPGTYYVIVEMPAGTEGRYQLTALSDPA